MPRLTVKNIRHVIRYEQDGMIYGWSVAMKTSVGARSFINYENGRTVAREYPQEWLPKEVIKFINSHDQQLREEHEWGGHKYEHYIIK